jgi:hypothetical protein
MNEGRQAIERRKLILQAVDTFIQIHDEWELDKNGPAQPSEKFERAVHVAMQICEHGDTPEDCRSLVGAVAKMGVEWILYENGKHRDDYCPTKAFWDTVRTVKAERIGAAPFRPRTRETVATLIKQGVGLEQIARANFADPEWENGYGPFLDVRGATNYDALERERLANEKGKSTLPSDWIHPDDRHRKKAAEDTARIRLQELQDEQNKQVSNEDPLALLKEGQYANVVARVCNMTLDEVMELANSEGLTVETTPNLAAMRAPSEPQINEAADRALQPNNGPDAAMGPAYEEPEGDTIAQQAAIWAARGKDNEEIADLLGLTPKKVRLLLAEGARTRKTAHVS